MVTVAPIIHAMPAAPGAAVEIPAATKRRLDLYFYLLDLFKLEILRLDFC